IGTQIFEMLVRFQKNFLADVFGFGGVRQQAHSGAEYHVLVILHERFELLRICHGQAVTVQSAVYAQNAARRKTVAYRIEMNLCIQEANSLRADSRSS